MEKPASCKACPYFERRYVPPRLRRGEKNRIVLIGESPGREELRSGEYFVGPSGEVLNMILEESHIQRDSLQIFNVIRCDPGATSGAVYDPLALEMCTELLWQDLRRVQPSVIVPMGNIALKAILNRQGISSERGKVSDIKDVDHETQPPIETKVVPTFHPAHVLRNPAYSELVVADFETIKKVSRGQWVGSDTDVDYRLFETPKEVYDFFEEARELKSFSLDTETTSLDYRVSEVICMSMSHTPYTAKVLPFFTLPGMEEKITQFWQPNFLRKLHDLLHSSTILYMQNGKYDLRMLDSLFHRTIGKRMNPYRIRWLDTQNMGALLNENLPHNLKDMAILHTDIFYDRKELSLVGKGQVKKMTMEELLHYAGQDADATLRLGRQFRSQLHKEKMWNLMEGYDYSDMEVLRCLYDMELFGAPLSMKAMVELRSLIRNKLNHFHNAMIDMVGKEFNPNSHPQIREILFTDLGFDTTDIRLTDTGQPSTDKETLDGLVLRTNHPFPRTLRLYRQYSTLLSTFIEGAEKRRTGDRLHPNFLAARTVSGRVVCVNPNLANIPRDKEFEEGVQLSIRGIYVAKKEWRILYGDWKQIEFKCAALLSGDEKLIRALFVRGEDFHTLTAESLFPEFIGLKKEEKYLRDLLEIEQSPKAREKAQRRLQSVELRVKTLRNDAKIYNFGQLYGGSDDGLAALMGISIEEVLELTKRRMAAYPELANFITNIPTLAIEQGYLETPYGRKRRFPYTPSEYIRGSQGRQGINVLPQSSAAYVARAALTRICKRCKEDGLKGFPFNTVYDSILNEHPREEVTHGLMIMSEEMTRPVPELQGRVFSVDLGVGKNWISAEKSAVHVASALSRQDVRELFFSKKG